MSTCTAFNFFYIYLLLQALVEVIEGTALALGPAIGAAIFQVYIFIHALTRYNVL